MRKGNSYFSRDRVRRALSAKASSVAASLGLSLIDVQEDECGNPGSGGSAGCGDNGECRDTVFMEETSVSTHGAGEGPATFVAPGFRHEPVCVCRQGFAGDRCEVMLNKCALQPCPSFKVSSIGNDNTLSQVKSMAKKKIRGF